MAQSTLSPATRVDNQDGVHSFCLAQVVLLCIFWGVKQGMEAFDFSLTYKQNKSLKK